MSKTAFIAKQKTCFILAAGTGKRMLPLTKNTPKPLLRINNKPMIDHILDLVKFHGFSKVGINLFYQGQKIENHLKKKNIDFIYEKKPTGTAGGILAISEKLKPNSPFLVISSDMMVNFDLTKIYNFHLKQKAAATICCYFRPKSKMSASKSGQVIFDRKTKLLKQVVERSEKIFSHWVNSSVYVFSPQVLQFIEEDLTFDIAKDLIPKILESDSKVFAYPINRKKFYQLGIDTPERIRVAEDDIKSGKFVPTIP